jgi:Putative transposase of IS4/5 family (DUF4096)
MSSRTRVAGIENLGVDEVWADEVGLQEWRVARFLRRTRDAAPLFLGIRLFVGWEWLDAGLHKLQDPAWFQAGAALRSYGERAATVPKASAQPTRLPYVSDLTDYEWQHVEPKLRQAAGPGRKWTVNVREILNAILYWNRTICQWRMLPHDFPYWQQVAYDFYTWLVDETLERIDDLLR